MKGNWCLSKLSVLVIEVGPSSLSSDPLPNPANQFSWRLFHFSHEVVDADMTVTRQMVPSSAENEK